MFKNSLALVIASLLFCSCGEKKSLPESDIDAARNFIKSIQDNDFDKAEHLILDDASNQESLSKLKKDTEAKSATEREKYKNADILVDDLTPINDSVSIVNYAISSNSTQKNKLKLIRINGHWLVDLKYTFSGNL